MDAALPCCNAFERHLARNVDVPTEWSHLSPALVEQLPNLVEKKGGFFARLFGR